MRRVGVCFAAWLAERGGIGQAEDTAAMAQVRQFFEAHGESRFTSLISTIYTEPIVPENARTVNRAGFRRRIQDEWEFLVLPEVWKNEVCRGYDPTAVADLLAARGLLRPGPDRKRSVPVDLPGEDKRRVYRVSGAILSDDKPKIGTSGPGWPTA